MTASKTFSDYVGKTFLIVSALDNKYALDDCGFHLNNAGDNDGYPALRLKDSSENQEWTVDEQGRIKLAVDENYMLSNGSMGEGSYPRVVNNADGSYNDHIYKYENGNLCFRFPGPILVVESTPIQQNTKICVSYFGDKSSPQSRWELIDVTYLAEEVIQQMTTSAVRNIQYTTPSLPINDIPSERADLNIQNMLYNIFESPSIAITPLRDITIHHSSNSPTYHNVGGNTHIFSQYDKNSFHPNYIRNLLSNKLFGVFVPLLSFITSEHFITLNVTKPQLNTPFQAKDYLVDLKLDESLDLLLKRSVDENRNYLAWNLNYNRDNLTISDVTNISSHYISKLNQLIHYIITYNITSPNDIVRSIVKSIFCSDDNKIYSFAHFTLVLPALVNYFATPNINGIDNHAFKYIGYIQKGSEFLPSEKGIYLEEHKHDEPSLTPLSKPATICSDYMFKQKNEYKAKVGPYNYPLNVDEQKLKWNPDTIKPVPEVQNCLSGINVPFIKFLQDAKTNPTLKDPYRFINNIKTTPLMTQEHLVNMGKRQEKTTYRQLDESDIKQSSMNYNSTISIGCTSQRLLADGSYQNYRFQKEIHNPLETVYRAPDHTYDQSYDRSTGYMEYNIYACEGNLTSGKRRDRIPINVENKLYLSPTIRKGDNPKKFVGFCDDNKCLTGTINLPDQKTFTRDGTPGNPRQGQKPYIAVDKVKLFGEFNPEGTLTLFDANVPNEQDHRFLTLYRTISDVYYFNNNVFKNWLELVLTKPALQTIINDIRKLVIQYPAYVSLHNTYTYLESRLEKEQKGSKCFIELPLGPPLLSLGSDFMFTDKYIYGCAAKEVIDNNYAIYDPNKAFTPLINSYIVDKSSKNYSPSSYLDTLYKELFEICSFKSNLPLDPKDRQIAIGISIPVSGTQIFELIHNRYNDTEDRNAFGNREAYVKIYSWQDLTKPEVTSSALLLIFFTDPATSELGHMLTGLYDKIGDGDYNISMLNVVYTENNIAIDIDSRNGESCTDNNRIWLYASKIGNGKLCKCTTKKRKNGDKTTKYVEFSYFGPDILTLPIFLRPKVYN